MNLSDLRLKTKPISNLIASSQYVATKARLLGGLGERHAFRSGPAAAGTCAKIYLLYRYITLRDSTRKTGAVKARLGVIYMGAADVALIA